jgi:hypothetical protein
MDISQTASSSLQSAQLQSLLAYLDPAVATQSGTPNAADSFDKLLNSTQSAAAANSGATTSSNSMAMLQALQKYFGANPNDPLLQQLNGSSTEDPFLQMLNATDGTGSSDPFLQAIDSTNGATANDPLLQALDGTNSSDSTGAASNSLAMLQALSANDLTAL